MSKRKALAAALALLLSLPTGALAGGAGTPAKEETVSYETRVYIKERCPISPVPEAQKELIPALAAIFIPLLIEKALGGIGGALKKAGAEKTERDSGRLPTSLYRLTKTKEKSTLAINPDFGCVVVVRGVFDKPGASKDADYKDDETVARLRSGDIPVNDLAAVYEAAVKYSDDKTALRYMSTHFEMRKFQGSRSSKKRGVVVSISIVGAGAKEGEPVLSLALVNLGEVTAGAVMDSDKLSSKEGSWLGGLSISAASLKALETANFPGPDPNKKEDVKTYGIMPVTIEGMFAETEDGNKALRFIGDVLEATKSDVAKTLSGEILKDRDKAEEEAATASEKLRQEEETAYAAYLKAKGEYCGLGLQSTPADVTTLNTTSLPIAQRAKAFEFQRAKRAWSLKLTALQNFGLTSTSARDATDACP